MFAEDSLEVILEVDEVDVAGLRVGQQADVTLEAFRGAGLTGEITAIAPKATSTAGSSLVVYEVHLALDDSILPLRAGMTADAELVVAEREGVLLVPNQAIKADRSSGTYSVNLLSGDTIQETAVTIGLRDSRHTQILDGLQAGDQVLVGNALPVDMAFPTPGNSFGG
jgi:HlyD family secretion protein